MDFGISLDPSSVPQRHTLYDSNEDDGQADIPASDLELPQELIRFSSTQPLTLVTASGTSACIFVRSRFRLKSVCSLEVGVQMVAGTYFPRSGEEKSTVGEVLQSEGGDTLFCLHEKSLKPEYASVQTRKLLSLVDPTSVLVLTSLPGYNHFSHHSHELSPQTGFLRSIITSSWQYPLPDEAKPLEPPNTLTGEAAAALTFCQVKKVAAAAIALYTVSSENMSEQVAHFTPLLEHPFLASITKRPPKEAAKLVKTLEPKPREDLSSLYT